MRPRCRTTRRWPREVNAVARHHFWSCKLAHCSFEPYKLIDLKLGHPHTHASVRKARPFVSNLCVAEMAAMAGAGTMTRPTPSTAPFTQQRASSSARRSAVRRSLVCSAAPTATKEQLFADLSVALDNYKRAPPSVKQEVSADVMDACQKLSAAGGLPKWGAAAVELPARRSIGFGDLRMVGVKDPQAIAKVSVRNDAAFLMTVVGTSSVAAVVLGQLPGDWGFWGAYGSGGISIVVLAIGSVNPGILQVGIDFFSKVFPDYRERVLRHEAAHFLLAHLLGVPVAGYSLMLGTQHTDLAEAALQKRLIEQSLEDSQVDRLSIIAMAGATAEAMQFEEVSYDGHACELPPCLRYAPTSTN